MGVMLQKIVRTDDDIRDAVQVWKESKHAAEKKYSPMHEWGTSEVTNMSRLFKRMDRTYIWCLCRSSMGGYLG